MNSHTSFAINGIFMKKFFRIALNVLVITFIIPTTTCAEDVSTSGIDAHSAQIYQGPMYPANNAATIKHHYHHHFTITQRIERLEHKKVKLERHEAVLKAHNKTKRARFVMRHEMRVQKILERLEAKKNEHN